MAYNTKTSNSKQLQELYDLLKIHFNNDGDIVLTQYDNEIIITPNSSKICSLVNLIIQYNKGYVIKTFFWYDKYDDNYITIKTTQNNKDVLKFIQQYKKLLKNINEDDLYISIDPEIPKNAEKKLLSIVKKVIDKNLSNFLIPQYGNNTNYLHCLCYQYNKNNNIKFTIYTATYSNSSIYVNTYIDYNGKIIDVATIDICIYASFKRFEAAIVKQLDIAMDLIKFLDKNGTKNNENKDSIDK